MISKLRLSTVLKILIVFGLLYLFLLGIKFTGASFKLFGNDFAEQLISIYSNPFSGLFTGILVTSIVQSSSTTTSLIVGLAGSGVLPIESAIPMVMGANMGTTITNVLVSLTFVTRKEDFRRAFTAATMHDFFNLFTIVLFLPLELFFHIIEKSAVFLTEIFQDVGGVTFTSPLKIIIDPVSKGFQHFLSDSLGASDIVVAIVLIIAAVILVVFSLIYLVKTMRSLVINTTEQVIDRFIFRNTFTAFVLGILLTAVVQSSSVTTSMIVPLVAAGFLGLNRAYPFTLGANIGTTITAILASLATIDSETGAGTVGLTVAFCHLMFNIYGTIVFLPLRKLPIYFAIRLGNLAAESKKWAFIFVIGVFFLVPLLILFITQ
ncbi:MAG: Na/Pi symporter [Dehalococcoidales bacterium]|nr:Na/Pi symporter [Dehalococcoidales bacterium]